MKQKAACWKPAIKHFENSQGLPPSERVGFFPQPAPSPLQIQEMLAPRHCRPRLLEDKASQNLLLLLSSLLAQSVPGLRALDLDHAKTRGVHESLGLLYS